MRLLLFIVFGLLAFSASSQVFFRNVTIVDVEAKKLVPAQDVIVENGLIAAIGKKLDPPAGAEIIDGNGKFLMPGLVDAHMHFFQSGGIYTRPDGLDLRRYRPYEEEVDWAHNHMESFLRRYLSAGITSVVDVGATVHFLKQRDSFRTKSYAPSIYMTGPLLTTWEPDVFRNMKEDEPFNEMKTVEDARNYVRNQLPYHPDFIKIWYIVAGPNLDSFARARLPLIQAVIDEAHKNQLRVAVHATEKITATLAVQAGADYLVHGVEDVPLDDAFVQLLKSKKTVLSPTLVVADNYLKVFGQFYAFTPEDFRYAHPTPLNSVIDIKTRDTALTNRLKASAARGRVPAEKVFRLTQANLRKLSDAGVIIATGTDAGNIGTQHVSSYFDELAAMRESGMDLWQLLQASTINGARAVGREQEFGSIKKGKRADLLLLSKNPLDSLSNWQSITRIVNKGQLVEREDLIVRSPEELADQQLLGYNAHNLDAFLEPYADDVEVYSFPNKLMMKGKEQMRKEYAFLNTTPKLYCRLVNRMVQGNMVVDHEEVWGFGDKPFYGIAIYEIRNGKISKVYFPE